MNILCIVTYCLLAENTQSINLISSTLDNHFRQLNPSAIASIIHRLLIAYEEEVNTNTNLICKRFQKKNRLKATAILMRLE